MQAQAQTNKWETAYQALTAPIADRGGLPWTEQDDAVLMDMNLRLVDRALLLGRSYFSCRDRIKLLRYGYRPYPRTNTTREV